MWRRGKRFELHAAGLGLLGESARAAVRGPVALAGQQEDDPRLRQVGVQNPNSVSINNRSSQVVQRQDR